MLTLSTQTQVGAKLGEHVHVLHEYSDAALDLQSTMETQMALMSSQQFEQVLHPIFQVR